MAERAVTLAFVLAVFTLDVSAFAVYRYLLVSDVLLLAAVALHLCSARRADLYLPKLVGWLFVLYLTSAAVAFARAADPGSGLFTWLHSVFVMLVYVPAATTLLIVRPDLRRFALPTMLAGATFQGLIVCYSVYSGLDWTTGVRIRGAFGSAQLWTYAAAVVGAVAILLTGRIRHRLTALLCLVPLLAAEAFLRSRMLWVATFLGASLFAVLHARRRGLAVCGAAAIAMLMAAGYALEVYPPAVQQRVTDALRPNEATDLRARTHVALAALDAIRESPLVGVGVGQAPAFFKQLPSPPLVETAHNIVVHASMEAGLLAGIALICLPIGLLALWRQARRRLGASERVGLDWAFATLTALYAAAQLTPTLFEHSFYFLVAFLAANAAGRITRQGSGALGRSHDVA